MTKYKVLDANEAVARVAYKFIELAGIYPITPASPMAEKIDVLSSNGEINFFGNRVKVVEMQSEAGAVATVHGALQSGILASTFTASQGLLLMIPTLYKLSGEMLPGVIHVAARSLSTHSLSIFGDHQDIYSVRSTGVCMLSSSSVEEAYHMAMIAHLSSIKASLPFVNFFDGFRTSHEIDKVKEVDLSRLEPLIDKKALRKHFKEIRLSMSAEERKQADVAVQQAFLDSEEYKSCTTVLAYVSSDIEVSTAEIVRKALKSKIVLCPRCEKNGNIMYFYRINSTYDLKEGRFGIFEPDESCEKYCVFDNALCIVPALSYDKDGYRLGFGMGFYDRFLADYNGMKLGLCYDNCMSESFYHDGYDISVDKVFTDKNIYTINTKERK